MLRLLLLLCGLLTCDDAWARTLHARIARVTTGVATLEGVRVQLHWPAHAAQGELRLQAARVDALDLGYRFRDLDWSCPLQRDGQGGWRCDGALRSGREAPFRLALDLGIATTEATLVRGTGKLAMHRDAATPDATRIDITQVPLVWAQALLSQAWTEGRITRGTLAGRLTVTAPQDQPLRVAGTLSLRAAAFDTPDGTIAAENIGAQLALDTQFADADRIAVDGRLHGGELLFGSTYVALQQRSVGVSVEATQQGAEGWRIPRFIWRDDNIFVAEGSAAFAPDMSVRELDVQLHGPDLTPLRDGYLSGWLGTAGLADLKLRGAIDARIKLADGVLHDADVTVQQATIEDPKGRFGFEQLDGDLRFSASTPVQSELHWRGGELYGLKFGATRLPFASGAGELRFGKAVIVPLLGGHAHFDHLQLRPPTVGRGLDIRFGLALEKIDIAQLAKALQWPAFTGELSGRIPEAHYADERLAFDGGLGMQLFGGTMEVSELAMERPLGVAPTLSADISFDDLDLEALTGVFGFGAITGKLDGRIGDVRLIDWQPVAFDAQLHTDRDAARQSRVRQRISQRAVQDLSSVGDASFVTSLQSRLIGLFDDFGYARIGIACKLADDICVMDGLGSAGQGFIIVEGSGVPRLSVVGFNRLVDWPTLVERLAAIGKGDVKPVVE